MLYILYVPEGIKKQTLSLTVPRPLIPYPLQNALSDTVDKCVIWRARHLASPTPCPLRMRYLIPSIHYCSVFWHA